MTGSLATWDLVTREVCDLDAAGGSVRLQDYRERTPGGVVRREVPAPQVSIIVSLDDPVLVFEPAAPSAPGTPPRRVGAFVAALDERPALAQTPQGWRGVQIDLSPPAARAVLGWRMCELSGDVVELDRVIGPAAGRRLLSGLRAAGHPAERLDVAASFVRGRVAASEPPPADVARAWRRMRQTGGALPIGALARELGCSRRHLSGRFAEHVGLPPKRAARIVRFRRALSALEQGPDLSLAAIAAACGFADQAHMTREVRELAGEPPARLAARLMPGCGIAA